MEANSDARPAATITAMKPRSIQLEATNGTSEVGSYYWKDLAPDIVNSGQEEQGSISF